MPALRLNRGQICSLDRLLDMMYKPVELAEEIGLTEKTVRRYIPEGMPFARNNQRIWINGQAFRVWAQEALATDRRGRAKRTLKTGEGYCMRCNAVVTMVAPWVRKTRRPGVVQVFGECSQCGAQVSRLARSSEAARD